LDVGSGAGLPGVILSIFGFERVVLCENNFKKSMFLKEVKERLDLGFDVFDDNVYKFSIDDSVSRGMLSSVTMVSRAFGSLVKLMTIMNKLKIKNGVFHKGRGYAAEIEDASKDFKFDLQIKKSTTSDEGVIILISNFEKG
jgi:16S rRNA (guanine527-N7)-methyltransferase